MKQLWGMGDHRNLEAWKEAREVTKETIQIAQTHWKPYASALFSQLLRATLSVQLNIAEGQALMTRPSFANHLRIAYGSAIEAAEILEMLIELGIIPEPLGQPVLERCRRSQRLLLGLIRYCREKQ